ncbi:MAG: carbon starvation protein A [Bacteroidaceae bacterium]|nr:carbon starvation protein A [Bacteroidaceae bacterium]
MVTFIASLLLLILGYVFYGAFVNKVFGADSQRKTPCFTSQDGVDYMPMPTWKVFLIQFLNIAGTGPIFGAIQGILFGPSAYLWIVLGCIFGGAVHDYMSGMISIRKNGASLPEIIGDELGSGARVTMRVMSLVLMILVGAVFATTPADILDGMVTDNGFLWSKYFWVVIIIAYYILATLLPIDKLIGKVYPIFGLALLIMAVGLGYGIFANEGSLPEITDAFSNHHPSSSIPIFPGLCITIACGAVSGFHATQSPMMARCLQNEKYGRPVFYGAMITEGIVALIWAAAAIKFADSLDVAGNTPYEKLLAAMVNPETGKPSPAVLVNAICSSWLGKVGAVLAVLGVVAAPITSGDTAFRSARLIVADFMHYKQNKIYKRVILSLPIFILSIVLMFINFDILWRYFAWFNQSLAVFTLWAITVWLTKRSVAERTKPFACLIALVPALWMTIVCSTYILIAPEGFQLNNWVAYILGGLITLGVLIWYILWVKHLVSSR